MTAWEVINSVVRLCITMIVIHQLIHYRDLLNGIERAGIGLFGGAGIMTIPVIIYGPTSPFEGWAGTAFAAGLLIYLLGRMTRHWRHSAQNRETVEAARRHFERKGA